MRPPRVTSEVLRIRLFLVEILSTVTAQPYELLGSKGKLIKSLPGTNWTEIMVRNDILHKAMFLSERTIL